MYYSSSSLTFYVFWDTFPYPTLFVRYLSSPSTIIHFFSILRCSGGFLPLGYFEVFRWCFRECSGVVRYQGKYVSTVEPLFNEGPRNWQNLFPITRFRYTVKPRYNETPYDEVLAITNDFVWRPLFVSSQASNRASTRKIYLILLRRSKAFP